MERFFSVCSGIERLEEASGKTRPRSGRIPGNIIISAASTVFEPSIRLVYDPERMLRFYRCPVASDDERTEEGSFEHRLRVI